MAKANFYLKKPNESSPSLIYLYFRYDNRLIRVSTGRKIKPQLWDSKNQRAKSTFQGFTELNNLLGEWKYEVVKIYNTRLYQKLPTSPNDLKPFFEQLIRPNKFDKSLDEDFIGLTRFITEYISEVSSFKNPNTTKTYKTHLKMLKEFEEKIRKGKKIAFEDITIPFYHELKSFMIEEKNYNDNTQSKHTSLLKFFLNEATERGLNKTFDYKSRKFTTPRKEVDNIYLDFDEIETLYNLDLSANERLERVRDLFVFGCFTGLRFSDFTNIQKENFSPDLKFLKIRTIKTDDPIEIPILGRAKDIILKYKGKTENWLPPIISNQKMNKYLKEIGELAKLDESVVKVVKSGKRRIETKHNKYDLITTHTARRSFATNNFLAGVPHYTIMAITGHKTEKAFLNYVKASKKQHAILLAEFWKNQLNK